jgi:hypothetical protein
MRAVAAVSSSVRRKLRKLVLTCWLLPNEYLSGNNDQIGQTLDATRDENAGLGGR